MSEFQIQHSVSELIDALGLTDLVAPEKFLKNLTTSILPVPTCNAKEAVQNLASLSANPEVGRRYEDLQAKNYAELDPLVVILSKIKESKTICRSVRAGLPRDSTAGVGGARAAGAVLPSTGDGPSTSTPVVTGGAKLKKLRDLLDTASEGSTTTCPTSAASGASGAAAAHRSARGDERTNAAKRNGAGAAAASAATVRRNPEWFRGRAFLSCDFPTCPPPPDGVVEPAPLGNLPVADQERVLVEELLYVLQGFDGDYIRTRPLASETDERNFDVDDSVDESLKEMVGRFLPLAAAYSTIQRFCESRSGFDHGTVNDALAAAVDRLVHDHRIFVCQLESLLLAGELNLLKAWYLVQPNAHVLHLLQHVVLSLMKAAARGGQVLSVLHQHTVEAMGNEQQQRLLLSLTRSASEPYWNILHRWVYHGAVEDPYGEFMIDDHQVLSMGDLSPTAYSDDYWEKRYSLRRDRVPSFLLALTDQILRTGKYLNVIKQCGIKVRPARDEDHLVYCVDGASYKPAVEKAYAYASETLLHLLMQDYDLLGRLKSVKHYFLLDAGDFILHFLSLCGSELAKNVDDVQPSRLESLLELALRTSTANADPFKDDLGLELLSHDLLTQMVRILSIQTNDERMDGNHSLEPLRLTGLEAFSFQYRVRWPVSLVFTSKVMACYQMIFRHLFFAKYVESLLGQVWITHKVVRGYSFPTSQWYNKAFALRHRMLNFVQNLLYYITVEVLEPSWHLFVDKIRKVDNVDQVISTHMELLNVCMKEAMLTDPQLLQTTTKLIKLCETFASFILKMHRHAKEAEMGLSNLAEVTSLNEVLLTSPGDVFLQETSDTFDANVTRMDTQFTALLTALLQRISDLGHESYDSHLLTLLNRLDFNAFYTDGMIHLAFPKGHAHDAVSG